MPLFVLCSVTLFRNRNCATADSPFSHAVSFFAGFCIDVFVPMIKFNGCSFLRGQPPILVVCSTILVFHVVIEDNEIVYRDYVDISVAVATPKVRRSSDIISTVKSM